MKKPKLSNVTGIVALSYLILIPAAGIFLWNQIQEVKDEVAEVWRYLDEKKGQEADAAGPYGDGNSNVHR